MYAPMLFPLIGLVAGILLAMAGASYMWGAIILIATCIAYFIIAYLTRGIGTGFRRNSLHNIWILMGFAGAGVLSANLTRPHVLEVPVGNVVAAQGHVTDMSATTSGDKCMLDVAGIVNRDGKFVRTPRLTLIVRSDLLPCEVDDEVTISGTLRNIEDSPNSFRKGYAASLANKGIYYELLTDKEHVSVRGRSVTIGGISKGVRDRLESFVENTALATGTKKFLITVLLGDRHYLDADMRDLFADAGLSHLLALSGMHVAIICGIFLWLLFPLNFFGLYKYRLPISALLLLGYAFIAGLAPSILRATLMMITLSVCVYMERKNTAWNSLLLATFLLLLLSPWALSDVGLQLSFLSVACLLFFVNPFNAVSQHDHPRLYAFMSAILATMAATLGTWCLSAWYFGRVPVLFLPANLMAVPLLPIYLVASLIYLGSEAVGLQWGLFAKVIDFFPEAMRRGLEMLGAGNSSIQFSPNVWTVILWLVLLAVVAAIIHGKRTRMKAGLAIVTGVAFLTTLSFKTEAIEAEGFLIRSESHEIAILYNTAEGEKTVKAPRQKVSRIRTGDVDVIVLDCDLQQLSDTLPRQKGNILLISGGCRQDLDEILRKIDCKSVVIHPSVRRKREAELLQAADSLHLPAHSIRQAGPYRIPTPTR